MTDFGLYPKDIDLIQEVFKNYPKIKSVKIFGSRAKGNFKSNSDIDLAIFGEISQVESARVALDLEELPIAYSFDVQAYNSISNQKLKEHIDRVGKVFYEFTF